MDLLPSTELDPITSRVPTRYESIDFVDSEDPVEEGGRVQLLSYLRALRRRKWILVITAAIGVLGGIFAGLMQAPVYQAETSVEIELGGSETPFKGGEVAQTTPAETQIAIFQSRTLREDVVGRLLERHRGVLPNRPSELASWLGRVGIVIPWERKVKSYESALRSSARTLKIHSGERSPVITLVCDAADPHIAADFLNALVLQFTDEDFTARSEATRRTRDWISQQVSEGRSKLERSEDALQNYARSSNLFTFQKDTDTVAEERLRSLQQELTRVQTDRMAKTARFEMMKLVAPEALPDMLQDVTLKAYAGLITSLKQQRADLSTTLTPAHEKVKQVEAQIAELESAMATERNNILKRIENEYREALRHEQALSEEYAKQQTLVASQSFDRVHYNLLKQESDANRRIYDDMLQKEKEQNISPALKPSVLRVIDPAEPASSPYKPNSLQYISMGLSMGLLAGCALVFIKEHMDRTLREPGDGSLYLRRPELGVIPSAGLAVPASYRQNGLVSMLTSEKGDPMELVTWDNKLSVMAESFRATMAAILFNSPNGTPRVMVVTSPCAGDGKSSIISNLGIALAEIGRRVLLVDYDMRSPRLHKIFNMSNSWGLSDLSQEAHLTAMLPVEALARATKIPNLYLLPSGPPPENLAQVLFSSQAGDLFKRFRSEFDVVLVDTPPIMQTPDARIVSQFADAVILVVRSGKSRREDAVTALRRLEEGSINVLGIVLNDWDPRPSGKPYGYYGYPHAKS